MLKLPKIFLWYGLARQTHRTPGQHYSHRTPTKIGGEKGAAVKMKPEAISGAPFPMESDKRKLIPSTMSYDNVLRNPVY